MEAKKRLKKPPIFIKFWHFSDLLKILIKMLDEIRECRVNFYMKINSRACICMPIGFTTSVQSIRNDCYGLISDIGTTYSASNVISPLQGH